MDILSHNPLDTTDAEDIPMVVKAKLAMARVVKIGDKRVYSESMWAVGERAKEYVQLIEALHADTPMTENNIESPDRLYGKVYTDLSIFNICQSWMPDWHSQLHNRPDLFFINIL